MSLQPHEEERFVFHCCLKSLGSSAFVFTCAYLPVQSFDMDLNVSANHSIFLCLGIFHSINLIYCSIVSYVHFLAI